MTEQQCGNCACNQGRACPVRQACGLPEEHDDALQFITDLMTAGRDVVLGIAAAGFLGLAAWWLV